MADQRMDHEAWPMRAALLLALGALCGLAIYQLIGGHESPSEQGFVRPSLATFVAISGLLFAVTLERERWTWSLAFALGAGAVLASIFYWSGSLDRSSADDGWRVVAGLLSLAIAAPLFQTFRDQGDRSLPYGPVHAHAWVNIVLWCVAWAFVAITWLLVQLARRAVPADRHPPAPRPARTGMVRLDHGRRHARRGHRPASRSRPHRRPAAAGGDLHPRRARAGAGGGPHPVRPVASLHRARSALGSDKGDHAHPARLHRRRVHPRQCGDRHRAGGGGAQSGAPLERDGARRGDDAAWRCRGHFDRACASDSTASPPTGCGRWSSSSSCSPAPASISTL